MATGTRVFPKFRYDGDPVEVTLLLSRAEAERVAYLLDTGVSNPLDDEILRVLIDELGIEEGNPHDGADLPSVNQFPLHALVRVYPVPGEQWDSFMGTITEVNDPDQGDFEYYVQPHDGSRGSYWPREHLKVLQSDDKHQPGPFTGGGLGDPPIGMHGREP